MNSHVRPFTPGDYAAAVEVSNRVWPEYSNTVADWQHEDEHRDPKCRAAKWVAEVNGTLVGVAGYEQYVGQYHPRKFGVFASILPEHQGHGLGTALYQAVLAGLAPFDPLRLTADTREDQARAVAFLRRHGFVEKMRSWESRLDVPAFDPTPLATEAAKPLAEGIVLRTWPELAHVADRERRMWLLQQELVQDVPSPDAHTPVDFDYFVAERLHHPDFIPDGLLVAVDGDEWVGFTQLWRSKASPDLYTGLTGVKRSHRRRHIALALKLQSIAYARSIGTPVIKTWNERNNHGMLAINERLGFVKQPAWIIYVKEIAG
jgi:RimJ/RimL family protein N-acetyltransferase